MEHLGVNLEFERTKADHQKSDSKIKQSDINIFVPITLHKNRPNRLYKIVRQQRKKHVESDMHLQWN